MPGLMRAMVRTTAVVGTATAVSGRVSRRQQGRWAAKDQQQAEAAAPPAEAPPAYAPPAEAPPAQGGDMDDMLAQLKELGALKEAGVLTEAEFEVQKDKILHP
jgi:Short C-terminal domain